MSSALRSGSHFNSSRTSRSISLSDFMIGSWSVQRGFAVSADVVADRDQFMGGGGCGYDDRQIPLQVYYSRLRSFVVLPVASVTDGVPPTGGFHVISRTMAARAVRHLARDRVATIGAEYPPAVSQVRFRERGRPP